MTIIILNLLIIIFILNEKKIMLNFIIIYFVRIVKIAKFYTDLEGLLFF
jgi:hypothetical protein